MKNRSTLFLGTTLAAVTIYGPTPYHRKADSPFYQGILDGSIYVEDFEDGALNTPGVSIRSGWPVRGVRGVDEDDGAVDGRGENGGWQSGFDYLPEYGDDYFLEITFSPAGARGLPTYAGLAMVGFIASNLNLTLYRHISAYDTTGNSFTGEVQISYAIQPVTTPYFSTVDDKFIGFYHSGGISKIIVGIGIIDHLQYGWAIPEPGTITLSGLAAALLLTRRRRAKLAAV